MSRGKDDELTTMRYMDKKLGEMDETTRKRVLDWLLSRTYQAKPLPKQPDLFGEDQG